MKPRKAQWVTLLGDPRLQRYNNIYHLLFIINLYI
jgi:hypothetical protein